MCLICEFCRCVKQESQFTVRVGRQKLVHSFMKRVKDHFNFPFQFLVSDRLDNGSTPILWIICPFYIAIFFYPLNNSCSCASSQASPFSKLAIWHSTKTRYKLKALMVSSTPATYI